jgi:hypothetical protein
MGGVALLISPESVIRGLPLDLDSKQVSLTHQEESPDGSQLFFKFTREGNTVGLRATRDPDGTYFAVVYLGWTWNPFRRAALRRLSDLVLELLIERGARWAGPNEQ